MENSSKKNVLDPFSFGMNRKFDSKILFEDNTSSLTRFISSAHGKSIIAKLASVSSQVEKIVGQCALRGELGE